jgi:hypothetical protein
MFKSYRFFPLHHIKETTYATWIVTICKPVPVRVSKVANFRRKGRDDLPADVLLEAQ